jgi:hypothetical protein
MDNLTFDDIFKRELDAAAALSDDALIDAYRAWLGTIHPDGAQFRALGAEIARRGLRPFADRDPTT